MSITRFHIRLSTSPTIIGLLNCEASPTYRIITGVNQLPAFTLPSNIIKTITFLERYSSLAGILDGIANHRQTAVLIPIFIVSNGADVFVSHARNARTFPWHVKWQTS